MTLRIPGSLGRLIRLPLLLLTLSVSTCLSVLVIELQDGNLPPVFAASTALTIDISLNSPKATLDSTPSSGPLVATL